MRKILVMATMVLAAHAGPTAAATEASAPMRWSVGAATAAGTLVESGTMTAVPGADGVRMTVVTDELAPGHAYTQWVIFFNHPEFCVTAPGDGFACGGVDLFANPAADPSAVYGSGVASATGSGDRFEAFVAGAAAPSTPDGVAAYAQWRVGNAGSPVAGLSEEQIASGSGLLTNPLGAEYHTVLLDHGPYDPETYGETQWTTHDGGCHVGESNSCPPMQAAGAMGIFPWTG